MQYPHRRNPDGFVDSICPRCYITIASATEEADLTRTETAHVCDRSRILHRPRVFSNILQIPEYRNHPPAMRQ